jgi:rapamycin-insensitive companion of mTOR
LQPTRLFATHQLGRILQSFLDLADWALQLMTTQLYDPAIEICDIAVMYLEEGCTEESKLQKVVAMRPALEHLGDIGHPLFMR